MKPVKIFKISLNMVKHNRLRSWLTIIGVVIGIASVMTVVTMGDYFHEQVTKSLEQIQTDTIRIMGHKSYSSSGEDYYVGFEESDLAVENEYIEDLDTDMEGKLTKKDIYTLRKIPEIQYIDVVVENYAIINLGSEEGDGRICGVDPDVWGELNSEEIAQGRTLKSGDRNVIVITDSLANEEFPDRKIGLNQILLLNNNSYRVVGILTEEEGGLFNIGWDGGYNIYMPYEEVYKIDSEYVGYDKEEGVYDSIEILPYEDSDVEELIEKMEQQLQLSRRVDEESKDYHIYADLQGIENVNKIITGLTAFLSLIAGISLIVGSVGIANSMFTSVLEKTKEIGIMKAIGARNREIMLIFLCNAALIGLVGGLIGIAIGTIVVQLIIFGISMYMEIPFEFTLSMKATIVATLVSIIVGLIAGYMPAKNASKLNPVDALRYE